MRLHFSIITAAVLLVLSSRVADAHSGGTNASGCHNETATGGYHCHNGGTTGGSTGGSTTSISTSGELPLCPNGQFYSATKSECVCGSGMIKNGQNKCVCKEGFEISTSKTFCARIPGSTKAKAPTRNTRSVLNGKSSSSKAVKSSSSAKAKPAVASVDCTIKGNISATKEKIYHVIGCPNYNQTIIDSSKGESMFCSESEAKAAGWRKALNCK